MTAPYRQRTRTARHRVRLFWWCPYLPVLLLGAASASGETLSVQELNQKVEQWRAGKKIPPQVLYQVEGRATPVGRHRILFRNCKLPFESEKDLNEPTRRNPNLEVTGLVVRDEKTGAYSFQVESVRELPSDLETFLEKRRELRREPAEKWYRLGEWARQRGEFYKDPELLARSEEAYIHAVEFERQALPLDDVPGRMALAVKAGDLKLSERYSQELHHDGLLVLWRNSRRQVGPETDKLLALLAELPGATQPLEKPDPELREDYSSSPRETYGAANAETRRKLHRMLYGDVLLRLISAQLAADGSNGFEVAAKIDDALPEQHALAESFRDKALAASAKEVEALPKAEMLALAEKYRERDQPQTAEQLIESWLRLRQRRLEPDDTEGLIALSDEFRNLLKRNDRADRMLLDGWKQNPKATDIAERLQQVGYRLAGDSWVTTAELDARPESPLDQAIRAGRIETGMTSGNVRRSLGEPQRLARAATSGEVTEVWTYNSAGTSRLTVRLKRNRRQAELTVVEVTQTAAERP